MPHSLTDEAASAAIYRQTSYMLGPPATRLPRRDLHRIVMSGFPDRILDSESPRADARALFHIDDDGVLTVRHRPDLTHSLQGVTKTGSETGHATSASEIRIAARVCAYIARSQVGSLPPELAKKHRPRGVRLPVPVGEEAEWFMNLLTRRGLSPRDVVIHDRSQLNLTHTRKERVSTITASATVTGGAALDEILVEGLGTSKNFGLGLVRTHQI